MMNMTQGRCAGLIALMVLLILPAAAARGGPNVLLIAVDDLNRWTGFLEGHPQTRTPHMDRLAAQGMVFRRSICASSECNPSRVALLTGYHAKTTGFTNNFLPMPHRKWRAVDEIGTPIPFYDADHIPDLSTAQTLPQWFRGHGYCTMGCGKIFHQHVDPYADTARSWDRWGLPQGWDLTRAQENKAGIVDGRVLWLDWGPDPVTVEATTDYRRAQWAAAQLHDYDGNEPFFLAVGFKKPHDPFYAPPEFFEALGPAERIQLPPCDDDDLADVPPLGRIMADKKPGVVSEYEIIAGRNARGRDDRREVARAYLACVAYVDRCVGVVLDALERSPAREDTIVVLWSDHGWHLGEKRHYHKFTLWEEALRAPLIIRAPGLPAGVCDRPVSAVDLFPTLVDLAGLPGDYLQAGYQRQGHSLVPLLRDPARPWNRPALTVDFKRFPPMTFQDRGERYTDQFLGYGLSTQHWKLIEYVDPNRPQFRQHELYDLDADPHEWRNLAEDPAYALVRAQLTKLLHRFPGGEDGAQRDNRAPVCVPLRPRPTADLPVGRPVTVTVEALDVDGPDDVRAVRFYRGREFLQEDPTAPFEVTLTPRPGTELTVVAVDRAGAADGFTLALGRSP